MNELEIAQLNATAAQAFAVVLVASAIGIYLFQKSLRENDQSRQKK